MSIKTLNQQKQICTKKHNDKYDYSLWINDVKNIDIVDIICPHHGVFSQRLSNHKAGSGCNACGKIKQTQSKRKNRTHFIQQCELIHHQKYDYSAIRVDVSRHDVVDIICPHHGLFAQRLNSHISGRGCRECAQTTRSESNRMGLRYYVDECNTTHHHKYDYSLWPTNIINTDVVDIICPEHGRYTQRVSSHMQGHACLRCSVDSAKETMFQHHGIYHPHHKHLSTNTLELLDNPSWLFEQHITEKKPIKQIAAELKVDDTTVNRRMCKHNIPIKHYFQSTGERQICEYASSLGVEVESNNRTVISPYELDVYIPQYTLAIEYCGLYWHSEQQGKDKHYHKKKHDMCQDAGIQLITVFEDEWQLRTDQVKRKIANLVTRSASEKIFARQCTIVTVSHKTKQSFFEHNHIQGNGPGSICYGLKYHGKIVACIAFIRTKNNEQYYLNRYATSCNVPGGFSKLLKHFERNNKWTQIISFADQRWSDGSLYYKCGFDLDKIIPPDYSYSSNGTVRCHKFNYRRKYLPKLLKEFNPNLSERQNCDNNGVLRIWDCGKMRFVKSRVHFSSSI